MTRCRSRPLRSYTRRRTRRWHSSGSFGRNRARRTLDIAKAQVVLAQANVKAARDQYDKDRSAYDADAHSISKNALDVADDALQQALTAQDVARRQYDLTKAGAWRYDIDNQQKTYDSLLQAYRSADALLVKYTITAGQDGVVLAVNAVRNGYVSPQGTYDTYTQGQDPVLVVGPSQEYLAVRCFVDEIPGFPPAECAAYSRTDVRSRL